MVPPNVYFLQIPRNRPEPGRGAEQDLRCKYAVISRRDLARGTSARAANPALWARLAQPCALVYARDPAARAEIEQALATAIVTLLTAAAPLIADTSSRSVWSGAFAATYRTELRAEKAGRPELIYEMFAGRYDRITAILAAAIRHWQRADGRAARRRWRRLRRNGRVAQGLRLAKTIFTFAGGLD